MLRGIYRTATCSSRTAGRVSKEEYMTSPSTQTPTTGERVNHLVTETFQAVTIALVGVLGILTVAATI